MLSLIEIGQNVVIIQIFYPTLVSVHSSFTGISRIALHQNTEIEALEVVYKDKVLWGAFMRFPSISALLTNIL